MCGISGIINIKGDKAELDILKSITDIIAHRGPDDEGFYTNESIGLGHRRLSILDLSAEGHQPMLYQGKYVIVFNGEIYNYIEIREELTKQGFSFRSETDTEVILAAYSFWGEECIERFNGMWAFAIYDIAKNIVFCSRDRFGVKPFYYTTVGSYFAFGSEIKQFTVLPEWKAKANKNRVNDFISNGIFDHTNETLFDGVSQLRGGHNLKFDLSNNTYQETRWYTLESNIKPFEGSLFEAKEKFKQLFQDSVKLRLRSDVKVGSCLSGGLDSSTIVCTVNQILRKEGKQDIQETVSSCFTDKRFDEQEYIDEVVSKTGVISHKVFPSFEDLLKQLEAIAWHQDEPFGSTSIFAQWNVFKEARKNNLIVMLDGQGADETLAGYQLFFEAYFARLITHLSFSRLSTELASYKNLYKVSGKMSANRLVKTFLPPKLLSRLRKYSSTNNIQLIKTLPEEKNNYIPEYFKGIKALSIDLVLKSNLPMLLHYEDRNSMAHSIESRVPFLDYKLVEFCLSLPDEYKIQEGSTKFVLRESMDGTLPDKIRNRHDKKAFVTPEVVWIKENEAYFASLLHEAADTFKDYIYINKLKDAFKHDLENLTLGSIYWRMISLHIWAKKYKVEL